MKRRDFIKTTTTAGVAATLMPHSLFSSPVMNERINMGFIGTGMRGQWVLWLAAKYPEIDIPAICDIDDGMIDSALKILKNAGKPKPRVYFFRRIFLVYPCTSCVSITSESSVSGISTNGSPQQRQYLSDSARS